MRLIDFRRKKDNLCQDGPASGKPLALKWIISRAVVGILLMQIVRIRTLSRAKWPQLHPLDRRSPRKMAGALPRRLAAAVWLLAVVVAASSGGSDDPAADDGGGEVVLMLEEEEGVAYARVLRPEGSAGWMELWQEGHRLMANTTELVHPPLPQCASSAQQSVEGRDHGERPALAPLHQRRDHAELTGIRAGAEHRDTRGGHLPVGLALRRRRTLDRPEQRPPHGTPCGQCARSGRLPH